MAVTQTWPAGLPGPSDENLTYTYQPRVRTARFGDGYEARIADGLNHNPRNFTMEWPNLTTAQKDTINNFLIARGGWEPFNWTPPREGSSIKVKCVNHTIRVASGPFWSIAVEFVQVYDA